MDGRVEEHPSREPTGYTSLVRAISFGLTFALPLIASSGAVHFLDFNMRHIIADLQAFLRGFVEDFKPHQDVRLQKDRVNLLSCFHSIEELRESTPDAAGTMGPIRIGRDPFQAWQQQADHFFI